MRTNFLAVLLITVCFMTGIAQEKEYSDGHGGKVKLPLGDISFADRVVGYTKGTPPPKSKNTDPKDAVGIPDFNGDVVSGFVSLGQGGELVLAFTDNALVNIEGPDLYVFEMGKYVEATFLYVSKDARKWINVGKISGGNALVDIGDSTKLGEIFTFVKLVDAKTPTKDTLWPGADIDAVAAIGSARQLSLNALYLFNTGESKIKPQAKPGLDSIVAELTANPNYEVVIDGHTDSIGNRKLNQKLSLDRANAIKTYILAKAPQLKAKLTIKTHGYADDYPVAANITEEGRERNRRVEVFFIPVKKTATPVKEPAKTPVKPAGK